MLGEGHRILLWAGHTLVYLPSCIWWNKLPVSLVGLAQVTGERFVAVDQVFWPKHKQAFCVHPVAEVEWLAPLVSGVLELWWRSACSVFVEVQVWALAVAVHHRDHLEEDERKHFSWLLLPVARKTKQAWVVVHILVGVDLGEYQDRFRSRLRREFYFVFITVIIGWRRWSIILSRQLLSQRGCLRNLKSTPRGLRSSDYNNHHGW